MSIIVSTTDNLKNKKVIAVLGIAKGSTVRSKNIARDVFAGLKNLIGGEIETYTEMVNKARDEAYERMVQDAKKMSADAILSVRFSTSMIVRGAAEILCYGTAVKLK